MRIAVFAIATALTLAACSPSAPANGGASTNGGAPSSASPSSGGGGFPQAASNAAFRQEATMTINGSAIPQVIYHDGPKIRTEMNGPAGQMINIINSDTHEAFNIMQVGGRTMATRTDLSQVQTGAHAPVDVDALRAQMQSRAHRLGSCSAAGENGSEWSVDAPEGVTTNGERSMCVTNDGIMIQMKVNGALVFDTQSLQRGPQDPSLFQLPPGVQATTMRMPSQASIANAVARARAAAAAAQGTP